MPETQVRHDAGAHRYEIVSDGQPIGFAEYRPHGETFVFVHTEIDPAWRGKGHAETLIRGALDDARTQGKRIKPVCEAVAAFVQRHPEYGDLVAA